MDDILIHQWEYHWVVIIDSERDHCLTTMGRYGWELAAVVAGEEITVPRPGHVHPGRLYHFYFKRPVWIPAESDRSGPDR